MAQEYQNKIAPHIYMFKDPQNTRKTSKNSLLIADLHLQIAGKHPVLTSTCTYFMSYVLCEYTNAHP